MKKAILPSIFLVASLLYLFHGERLFSRNLINLDFDKCETWHDHEKAEHEIMAGMTEAEVRRATEGDPDATQRAKKIGKAMELLQSRTEAKDERYRMTCEKTTEVKQHIGALYKCIKDPYNGAPTSTFDGPWVDGYRAPTLIFSTFGNDSDQFWRIDCDLSDRTCKSYDVRRYPSMDDQIHTDCTGKY